MGKQSVRRLELIERNRVLLALKLFPLSLLWANPFYFAARLLAGFAASRRGAGDTAHFPGIKGKRTIARALFNADVAALRLVPRMLRKRREMRSIRKLTPAQVRVLLSFKPGTAYVKYADPLGRDSE